MRFYVVTLVVTWAVTVIASSESNVANLSDEQTVSHAEFRDLPTKQVVQPYVTRSTEARDSRRRSIESHPDDAAELSGSAKSERESDVASTTESSASVSIYTTPLVEKSDEFSFRERLDDELGYVVPEDEVLLVENAGSFGQRVRQGLPDGRTVAGNIVRIIDEYDSTRKPSTTSLMQDESRHETHAPTQKPFVFASKKESDVITDSPLDDIKATDSKRNAKNSNETINDDDSTESPSAGTDTVPVSENDVVPEYLPTPQARYSRRQNSTNEESTKKPTKTIEKIEKTTTSVEITPSLQVTRFSGPIVVPDLFSSEAHDAAADYTDDSNASMEILRSVEKTDSNSQSRIRSSKAATPAISNSITSSSIMLNPLQVGITLMNAGMDDSEEFAATETRDYLQDEPQRLPVASKGNVGNENFPSAEGEKPIENVTRKTSDNSVEIQKSIELYHTAPIQEIHYPPEYIHQISHLGVVETNNIGGAQRSRLPYSQDERAELRTNYDAYRGSNIAEKSVFKEQAASAISPSFHRQEYNALEDNVGADPIQATALIAEYSSPSSRTPLEMSLEQRPPLRYNDARPVLLLANQYEDTLYDQSGVRHNLDNHKDASLQLGGKSATGGRDTARQREMTSEFVKPYSANAYQEQQQPPSNHHQPNTEPRHPFRASPEPRRPEAQQLMLKIVPNGAPSDAGFLIPIPRPYPIEKIVEKTVHVPHPIKIEKVIERKVPFPIERIIEKQVQVPVPLLQPYPVHMPVEKQTRVYPIHVERLFERNMPYTLQRLVVQPSTYPQQPRLPPVYPTSSERVTDKPATGSRIVRPYRTDGERPIDHSPIGALEVKFGKFNQPKSPLFTAGDSANPFETRQTGQIANVSHFYGDSGYGRLPTYIDYNVEGVGKGYSPTATTHLSNVRLVIVPKKVATHHTPLRLAQVPSYASLPLSSFRRQVVYNLVEKDRGGSLKDEYVGPVPPRKSVFSSQVKTLPTTKAKPLFSSATQSPATTAALRRARQPEYPGSFRQSKMEYGFKPPMIPSIQYDESTATKVEN